MTKNLKIGVIATLLLFFVGMVVFVGASQTEAQTQNQGKSIVGYVDVNSVFAMHPQKIASQNILSEEVQLLTRQMENDLKDMSQEERIATMEKYQESLIRRENELINMVITSIDETIREVANELGFKIVLEKKQVVYGGYDLTEEVKARIMQKYGE